MSGNSWDQFVSKRRKNPGFAEGMDAERRQIDQTDAIMRGLDGVRMQLNMSKAELARRIDAKPEVVRRLFTSEAANPTLGTLVKLADALGLEFQLVRKEGVRSDNHSSNGVEKGAPPRDAHLD